MVNLANKLDPMRDNFNVSNGISRLLNFNTLTPSRQLIRQYLRELAVAHLRGSYPGEDRRIIRKMAFRLATRPDFIAQAAKVTNVQKVR